MINLIVKDKERLDSRLAGTVRPLSRYLKDSKIVSINELKKEKNERFIMFDEPDLIPEEFRDILWFSFEGTKMSNKWLSSIDNYKLVLVPSKHCYDLYLNSGVPKEKLHIVPFGIDLKKFNPVERKWLNDKFVFMFVGGWIQNESDRKGLKYLLEAYQKEFNVPNDVVLLIKLNMGSHWDGYNFENGLRDYGFKRFANKIYVDTNVYADNFGFNPLYSQCDVFVSPSRAEAFNMPVLEAMANGRKCIVTGWGGHTDYCKTPPNEHIKYILENAPTLWCGDLYKDSKWAVPDVIHLRELMRKEFEEWKSTQQRKFIEENLKTARRYKWQEIIKRLRKVMM